VGASNAPATPTPALKPPAGPRPIRSVAAERRAPGERARSAIDDFVPLPAALGLPAFESGQIVRVDLPVASLPSFGVEILPEAGRTTVEADFLVGQDGRARAIRLVRTDEDTRSRQ
jgi:hypothetical protein